MFNKMNYHKITINLQTIVTEDINPFDQLSLAEKFAECIVDILNNYDTDYDAKLVTTEIWGCEVKHIVKFKGDLSACEWVHRIAFLKAFCPHLRLHENWYYEPLFFEFDSNASNRFLEEND